jgi:DNA-binding NarL/FixJ family response regulator
MEVIKLLNEYPFLVERIKEIHKQIAELNEKKVEAENSLKANTINDMPKNPNVGDPVFDLVTKILSTYVEEIAKLLNQELDLMAQKIKTENMLKKLTPKEYTIIKLRHFEGLKFYQIARKVFYSKSATWEMYQAIIKKLEEKTGHSGRYGQNGQAG